MYLTFTKNSVQLIAKSLQKVIKCLQKHNLLKFETSTFVLVCTCTFTQMYLSQIFTHSVIRDILLRFANF